jgi:hypothetical protein
MNINTIEIIRVFIINSFIMRYGKQRLFEMMAKIDPNFRLTDLSETLQPSDLNQILDGYITAALWTEEERLRDENTENNSVINREQGFFDDVSDESPDEIKFMKIIKDKEQKSIDSFSREDIDANSLIKAYTDIKQFIKSAGDIAVNEAIEEKGLEQLGHDIWLTRNGHGAGFFDRSYENEQPLMDAAKALSVVDLYLGDDGKLYFSNEN